MQSGFQITTARRRRAAGDTFVPMINIVFLLLIFFLLSATIAPPDLFDMTLPEATIAEAETVAQPDVLHVAATGEIIFGEMRGDAALRAVATRENAGPLALRADAQLDGTAFSALLGQLAALGVTDIELTVRQP
jgi:biopolymer transport protein ExbD